MYHPVIPNAEPFFFPGGETGILLVHGLTGTPKEMRWMGEYLAGQGHTVLGIRLAGHATHPDDLTRTRWADWLNAVEDGIHLLHSVTKQAYVMGLSLGGNLALISAARFPIHGVVALSTPYALPPDPRLPFIKLLGWLIPSVPKDPPDWRNLAASQDHIEYPAWPTKAIVQLRDLLVEMRLVLPAIQVPVLLVHSRQDASVPPQNAEQIYAHLGTPHKKLFWVENSGHVVIREPERESVFRAATEFIQRVNAGLV